jgi:hypothetical protein
MVLERRRPTTHFRSWPLTAYFCGVGLTDAIDPQPTLSELLAAARLAYKTAITSRKIARDYDSRAAWA